MNQPVIKARGLRKTYAKGVVALTVRISTWAPGASSG